MQVSRQQNNPNKIVQLFVFKLVICYWHRMTGEVDGYFDPYKQGPPTTTMGNYRRWDLFSLFTWSKQKCMAFLEGRLLSSQSEQFKKYS